MATEIFSITERESTIPVSFMTIREEQPGRFDIIVSSEASGDGYSITLDRAELLEMARTIIAKLGGMTQERFIEKMDALDRINPAPLEKLLSAGIDRAVDAASIKGGTPAPADYGQCECGKPGKFS